MPSTTPPEADQDYRRRRRRGRAAGAAWLLGLSVLVGTATGVLQSDRFRVRRVTIRAPSGALGREVARWLHLRPNAPLLTVDVWALARQAERHPWVRKVTVTRRLPDQLDVRVEPRRAFLALRQKARFMLVDAEGYVLGPTTRPPAGMLRVRGIDLSRLRPGERLTGQRWAVVRRCADLLSQHRFRGGTLDVAGLEHVRLVAPDGVLALLGPAEQCEQTLPLFLKVQAYLSRTGQRAAYVDLQVPELPTWLPRSAAAGAGRRAAQVDGTSRSASPHASTPVPAR